MIAAELCKICIIYFSYFFISFNFLFSGSDFFYLVPWVVKYVEDWFCYVLLKLLFLRLIILELVDWWTILPLLLALITLGDLFLFDVSLRIKKVEPACGPDALLIYYLKLKHNNKTND